MSAHRFTEIRCDFKSCRTTFIRPGHSYQVRAAASKAGWNVGATADWCPDHRTKASRMHIAAPAGTPEVGS